MDAIVDPHEEVIARIIAEAGHVVRRPVPHPRLVDALSPSQRTRVVEALLFDSRPVVALATAEAIEAVRRGR